MTERKIDFMKTDLFHIGKFVIHGYGLMIGIGFVLALLVGEYRAKKMGMKEEALIDIAIIAGVSGFLGAKLLYIIVSFKDFINDPMGVLGSSGFVVYGGLIAGVLCNLIYVKIKKLSFLEYFDLVMPEIALAQGFGRIGWFFGGGCFGCYLAGCCYGRVTDSAFGVIFPVGSQAPAGVKLIPTQLISSGADFLNMAFLMIIAAKFSYTAVMKRKADGKETTGKHMAAGNIGFLYCITYGLGRFAIEFLRNDYRGEVGIFSTSQFISLFIVLLGVVAMAVNHKLKNAYR